MDRSFLLKRTLFVLPVAAILAAIATQAVSQPSVISPQDIARTNQYSNVSGDFASSPAWDFEHPIALDVTLHHIHIPEGGYANLVFTVNRAGEGAEAITFDPEQKYIATLHLGREVKKLKLGKDQYSNGATATLIGWPASGWNVTNSAMLVDEMKLHRGGKWLGFHQPNDKMKKHPGALNKGSSIPQDKDPG